jgi:hypothetical protein
LINEIACKPVGRRRWLHGLCAPFRTKGPVGRREFEIKDADPFDKDVRPGHAFSAHPLRKIGGGRCVAEMPMKWAFLSGPPPTLARP